jgi:hypothetical protein
MVELQPSKLAMRVRFPSPALARTPCSEGVSLFNAILNEGSAQAVVPTTCPKERLRARSRIQELLHALMGDAEDLGGVAATEAHRCEATRGGHRGIARGAGRVRGRAARLLDN